MSLTRRRLLAQGMLCGAAFAAAPFVFIRKTDASWARGTAVHPQLDHRRVVGITDPQMTRGEEPNAFWGRQEELTDRERTWENMDRLACALAQTRNAGEAWRSIFVKPPGKTFADAIVAIKTNNISQQHTRSAVMSKVCHVLTDLLGVKPNHIHIYDAVHGRGMSRSTPFSGLPEGCRIEDHWGGVTTPTRVALPWKEAGTTDCVKHLVDGSVDILVNIALCKGHSPRFGGFTMTMKNHFGTFAPSPGHWGGGLDYLLAVNQTPEILGELDKRTGRVLYPRQQLCLVDALWASRSGPAGNPTHQPNFLAMGVHAPVVDYLIATRFRQERMNWPINTEATKRFLSDFGYEEGDLPHGKIIEAG